MTYIGRFAPSPTGPLHLGSVVAAAASYLDARAHRGRWQVRIEDLDTGRCDPAAARNMIRTLEQLGMVPDEPVVWQSRRLASYEEALSALRQCEVLYPCACTRAQVRRRAPHPGVYAGTCRQGLPPDTRPRSLRVRLDAPSDQFTDRFAGPQHSEQGIDFGDPVVRRADGSVAYVLAGAVDDVVCGVTDVVRGDDLLPTTATQRLLLGLLGMTPPRYAHIPVVLGADGRKLSKQNHAPPVDTTAPTRVLRDTFDLLGLPHDVTKRAANMPLAALWEAGVQAWRDQLRPAAPTSL